MKRRKNKAMMSRPITIRLDKGNLWFIKSLGGSVSQIINTAVSLLHSRFIEKEEREEYWRLLIRR
ncbi:hypothetical protein COU58_04205 [Candidatus Pacearchaeota archaeon CG10_big_fil_rev_8_21_14_0_10_32_42]|nr:MAG: hypothetical protein COU58_04205 [Candidatus Pacearchaeota archaeon CG10_big_fil_rev_8_21_14_0_10_32_42]